MTRPSTYMTLAFIAMNLLAAALGATGVADFVGFSTEVGGDDTVDDVTQEAQTSRSSAGVGDTLFALYHSTSVGIASVFSILPAFSMLRRAGVPGVWIGVFTQIATFIIGIDIVSFLKGYDL